MRTPSGASESHKGALMSSALMVYGATGYVGENIAREATRSGTTAIIAGRDGAKLDRIAGEIGLRISRAITATLSTAVAMRVVAA